MGLAAASLPPTATIADPFGACGSRVTGGTVERVLEVRPDLTGVGPFEFAVRERIARLATFHHASFVHVRGVERTPGRAGSLLVVSDAADGTPLASVVAAVGARELTVPVAWTLSFVSRLLDALTALHATGRDVSHGALTLNRVLASRSFEPLIAEYVFGAALEQLRWPSDQYWSELGAANLAGCVRFDQSADLFQVGLIGVSLLAGRAVSPLSASRVKLQEILTSVDAGGGAASLLPDAQRWLAGLLQIDKPFTSAREARAAMDEILGRHGAACGERPVLPESFSSPGRDNAGVHVDSNAEACAARVAEPEPEPSQAVPAPAELAAVPASSFPIVSLEIEPHPDDPAVPALVAPPPPPAPPFAPERESYPVARKRRVFLPLAVAAIVLIAVVVTSRPLLGRYRSGPSAVAGAGLTSSSAANPANRAELSSVNTPSPVVAPVSGDTVLPPEPVVTGTLQVRTQPSGALVLVDGVNAGRSPVSLTETPGDHTIVITGEGSSFRDTVNVARGATTSLVVPLAAAAAGPAAAGGWISVSTPIDMQIFDEGRLVGTTGAERVMLPAGPHQLNFVNTATGYRAHRGVNVVAGKVTSVAVDVPRGLIAINASPWAEVWLDGERIGPTPLGNVVAAIGSHDLVFRHPTLGEQHRTVVVPVTGIARTSVDMNAR